MLILHAPEKIVTHAKTYIKMFWCHPVSVFFYWKFFGVFGFSWARLFQRAPPISPLFGLGLETLSSGRDFFIFVYFITLLLSF